MNFHSQVMVIATSGRCIYCTHPARAAQMVHAGEAEISPEERKTVRRIQLVESPGKPVREATGNALAGTRFTRKESIPINHRQHGETIGGMSRITAFKHIDSRDWKLFRQVQFDCGAVVRTA